MTLTIICITLTPSFFFCFHINKPFRKLLKTVTLCINSLKIVEREDYMIIATFASPHQVYDSNTTGVTGRVPWPTHLSYLHTPFLDCTDNVRRKYQLKHHRWNARRLQARKCPTFYSRGWQTHTRELYPPARELPANVSRSRILS